MLSLASLAHNNACDHHCPELAAVVFTKMVHDSLPAYIRHCLLPTSYFHHTDEIRLVQTHISFVVLAGNFVYKWKKPVDFGFVNFSSLAQRKYFCERELALNRRLCPDIYLDVVWMSQTGSDFRLMGDGTVIEYGVRMARMPEDQLMNRVIARGELRKEHLEAIVDILLPFYEKASGDIHIQQYGYADNISRNVAGNFVATERFVGSNALPINRFSIIKRYTENFLLCDQLFSDRVKTGHIRECHGDLYSGNICLADIDRIHIFDCIEFNESLRCIDICSDIAFLIMDLDFHDLRHMSNFLTKYFIEKSGDEAMVKVLNFYKCYRACVRGKVSLLAACDENMDKVAANEWSHAAGKYFQLAEEYALK